MPLIAAPFVDCSLLEPPPTIVTGQVSVEGVAVSTMIMEAFREPVVFNAPVCIVTGRAALDLASPIMSNLAGIGSSITACLYGES